MSDATIRMMTRAAVCCALISLLAGCWPRGGLPPRGELVEGQERETAIAALWDELPPALRQEEVGRAGDLPLAIGVGTAATMGLSPLSQQGMTTATSIEMGLVVVDWLATSMATSMARPSRMSGLVLGEYEGDADSALASQMMAAGQAIVTAADQLGYSALCIGYCDAVRQRAYRIQPADGTEPFFVSFSATRMEPKEGTWRSVGFDSWPMGVYEKMDVENPVVLKDNPLFDTVPRVVGRYDFLADGLRFLAAVSRNLPGWYQVYPKQNTLVAGGEVYRYDISRAKGLQVYRARMP